MSAAGSLVGAPDPGALLALWRLLVAVMGESAPRAVVLADWKAYDRALVRHWAERELARRTVGADGCPSLAVPPALKRFIPTEARPRAAQP